jgi:hypothetical protein
VTIDITQDSDGENEKAKKYRKVKGGTFDNVKKYYHDPVMAPTQVSDAQ